MNDLTNEVYKPRKHPGRMDSSVVTLPNTFVKAVLNTIEGNNRFKLVTYLIQFYRREPV